MRLFPFLLALALAACDSPAAPDFEVPEPAPPPEATDFILDPLTGDSLVVSRPGVFGDGSLGDLAFRVHCGTCHASRDGFDLAFFDFADDDIIRRGVAHVDTATVLAIRDYIHAIRAGMTTVERETELFRPGTERLGRDVDVALTLFGQDAWPRDLSVDELLGVDPRDIALAAPFPTWSSESSENDWMPETPLPDEVLDADGGRVRGRLIAYYDTRTDAALRLLVDDFEDVATRPGAVCEGTPGFHPRPLDCLEARRWLSSLSAMHLLQHGITRSVPEYLADLWWRVGEAAVSWSLGPGNVPSASERRRRRRVAVSWMMLSWVYDPARVDDNTAYFSEFTKHTDEPRQGGLAYAYWLVSDPAARDGVQVYDVMLQMLVPDRVPDHWYADYAHWMLDVVNGFMDVGHLPRTPEALEDAIAILDISITIAGDEQVPVDARAEIRERLRALKARLEGLR